MKATLTVLLLFAMSGFPRFAAAQQEAREVAPAGEPQEQEQEPERTPADWLKEHQAGSGFSLAKASWGELDFSLYSFARYLNQMGLDQTYTDSTGDTRFIDRRNDLQLQKALLYFKGWVGTPRFRYLLYIWTSNTSQGQGAQVVVAGNLTYRFNEHLTAGVGIGGLPATRSVRGQWPFWLKQDNRTIADEYFRASYTSGIWANGAIGGGFNYRVMLGNNLSQLGVDAGQLDSGFDTLSTAVWWASDGFGAYAPLGDFEHHDALAASFGAAFTRSNETRQSQPGKEDPENTQIRLSDGRAIFDLDAIVDGVQVLEARYQMAAFDGALKYRGFSLEGEYFMRWVTDLVATDVLPVEEFYDHGMQLQASAMLLPRSLQAYAFTSKIWGEYGEPSDVGGGLNWFPFESRVLRLNGEALYARNSPVGYLSYPLVVGANGPVYMANLELFF